MSAISWVAETLRKSGVEFAEVRHAEAFSAQQLAHRELVSGRRVAKVVVVYADDKPVMLVLPATHKVLPERFRAAVKAGQVRLASESDLSRLFPDCELGAEPPLRHAPGMEVWMDESLDGAGPIVFNAGTHRDGIRMAFSDWFDLVQPRVGEFATEPGRYMRRAEEED